MSSERLFHLLAPADAAPLLAGEGEWRPPSLAREGFVHLSLAQQLEGTLAVHYAEARTLTLLELDPRRVEADLRLEVSRGGALFPHLYRSVRATDVRRSWTLARGPEGWRLPALGAPGDY